MSGTISESTLKAPELEKAEPDVHAGPVLYALYGADETWLDVTYRVRVLQEKCGNFVVDNRILGGDPAPGIRKELRVRLTAGQTLSFYEGGVCCLPGAISFQTIEKSNLAFHLAPLSDAAPAWKWHVRMLKKYADWINGRRVIGVTLGEDYDDLQAVMREFRKHDFRVDEWIVRPADASRGAGAMFPHLLAKVLSRNPAECTFYAHSKSVECPSSTLKGYDPLADRLWTAYLYHYTLGQKTVMHALLEKFPCAGMWTRGESALVEIYRPQVSYPGAFFAFRHDALFSRNWNWMPPEPFWPERYSALMFQPWEMASVISPEEDPGGPLRDGNPEFSLESWRSAIRAGALDPLPAEIFEEPALADLFQNHENQPAIKD